MTLNVDLFAAAAVQRVTIDPAGLAKAPLDAALAGIQPFASCVIVITPSKPLEGGVDALLTVTLRAGSASSKLRAVVYRGGATLAPGALAKLGASAGDILTVLVSNVDHRFEATVVIAGQSIPFSPRFVLGGFGEFSGATRQTGLPSFMAGTGTAGDLSQTFAEIITSPRAVAGPGTYALGPGPDVFDGGGAARR